MRTPARLVSVGFLSVLTLMLAITALAPHAYGYSFLPPTVSPNPAVAGQPITVSGTGCCTTADTVDGAIFVDTSAAHDCSSVGSGVISFGPQALSPSLKYSFTITLSSPGFYCVSTTDSATPITDSGNTPLSVTAAPIPEYPFGLAVLAILMIVGYGVIRRKTITKHK